MSSPFKLLKVNIMATSPQMTAAQFAALNMQARATVLGSAVEMTQQIFSTTVVPANTNVVNVVPRNVGLITGFWVKVVATIANAAGSTATTTDFNAANILSQVVFNDLNNNVRINTTGWHLNFLSTAKNGSVADDAFLAASFDTPIKYGSNFVIDSATASIAASTGGTVNMWYWIPLAYSKNDLRGAVYANVVNSTMNLQLTINPNSSLFAASGDTTNAVYGGNTGTASSVTITVYQEYLDQLPIGPNGVILPVGDLSTIYELKNTVQTGLTPNQDFPVPYSNFRSFLSTTAIFYNGTARTAGTDVNYVALQSANFTKIFQYEPKLSALKTRNQIGVDYPLGVYYFDHRRKPINTVQFGNMEMVFNCSTAGAGAYVNVGYESFAQVNTVTQAGSLSAG